LALEVKLLGLILALLEPERTTLCDGVCFQKWIEARHDYFGCATKDPHPIRVDCSFFGLARLACTFTFTSHWKEAQRQKIATSITLINGMEICWALQLQASDSLLSFQQL